MALMQHVIKQSTSKVEPPIQASPSSTQPSVSVGGGQTEVLETAPVRGTRAATAREQRRDEDDEFASAQSECRPRELVDVIDFPESYFEDDLVTTPVAALCTWPEGDVVDIPLPNVVSSDSDKGKLVTEQQSDRTS